MSLHDFWIATAISGQALPSLPPLFSTFGSVIGRYSLPRQFIMEPSNSRFHGLKFANMETKPWEIKVNAELNIGHLVAIKTPNNGEKWTPAVITKVVDVVDVESNEWHFYYSCRYSNALYDKVPLAEAATRMRQHVLCTSYLRKHNINLLTLTESWGCLNETNCVFFTDEQYEHQFKVKYERAAKKPRLSELSAEETSESSSEKYIALQAVPKPSAMAPPPASSTTAALPHWATASASNMPPPGLPLPVPQSQAR